MEETQCIFGGGPSCKILKGWIRRVEASDIPEAVSSLLPVDIVSTYANTKWDPRDESIENSIFLDWVASDASWSTENMYGDGNGGELELKI